MGRMYTAEFKGVDVTASQDLLEVVAASTTLIKIHAWTISQSTEVGDTEEEMLLLTTNRGEGVTTGTGGSVLTAARVDAGDAAFAGSLEANNTTIISAGTITELEAYAWNVRVPFQMFYTPETRPTITPGDTWTLELESTPNDTVTMSGTLLLEELGG